MSFLKEEYPELMWDGDEKLPIVVNFGAGVDSTAILVGLHQRGIRPDYIVFSDTGAERPDIYAHIKRVNKWLATINFPQVSRVYKQVKGKEYGLADLLRDNKDIPSLAYGYKTCSIDHKIRPVEKFLRSEGVKRHIGIIGYGTGEIDRALKALGSQQKVRDSKKRALTKFNLRVLWFPLIDWKLNRDECKKLSKTVGFCTAKSSCFFCPAMRLSEIVKLRDYYPELYDEALKIEDRFFEGDKERRIRKIEQAKEVFGKDWQDISKEEFIEHGLKKPSPNNTMGLGRNWSWRDKIEEYDNLPPELPFMEEWSGADMGCGCTDF
tara:strand:+ start:4756 stop:5721 length:966 start_codon:yes stop_codon:yes gene_type:complete